MRETLKKLRENLVPIYGKRETEAIIKLIFLYLKNWNATDILIHGEDELSEFVKSEVNEILERLLKNEPIQYITGTARFHGMDFKVNPDVLIPRPETDEMTDLIISDYEDCEDLEVLDIGTGSGCIAITLARFLKFAKVTAIDKSENSLVIAKENAERLKTKVTFKKEDIFDWEPDHSFDIIVSNPPYIPLKEVGETDINVYEYEPASALFVPDSDPILFYKRIIALARKKLKKSGSLYFEINPHYSGEIGQCLISSGFENIDLIRDSYGKDRIIRAKRYISDL